MSRPFRPHQKGMFRYTLRVDHPCLFVKPRLGKTLVTIRRTKLYIDCPHKLIIAPYSAWNSWRKEIKIECNTVPFEIIDPGKIVFEKLAEAYNVYEYFLINPEGWRRIPDLDSFSWDVVIADESTFLKNPKSEASKRFIKMFRDTKHRWILTGTPDSESELNYWAQLQFVDPNILNEPNWWKFILKYFAITEYERFITNAGRKFLQSRLAKYCYFLSLEDVGMFQQEVKVRRFVKMPTKIERIYKKVAKEFILEVDNNFKLTSHAVVKYGWLRELCNGMAYVSETEKKLIWSGKLDLLDELVYGEFKKEKIIIWCAFRADIQNIVDKYSKPKSKRSKNKGPQFKFRVIHGDVPIKKRDKYIAEFQKGLLDWLIIQPKCMRFGEDLSLANVQFFYSTPTGSETREQCSQRIFSLAQNITNLTVDFVVEKSLELDILNGFTSTECRQSVLRNVVKRIQKEFNL